jgi:hypothetical protein
MKGFPHNIYTEKGLLPYFMFYPFRVAEGHGKYLTQENVLICIYEIWRIPSAKGGVDFPLNKRRKKTSYFSSIEPESAKNRNR